MMDIKPCPRCGGKHIYITDSLFFAPMGVKIVCYDCRYEVSGVDIKIAIDAWNARWLLWKKELKDCRMKFIDS